MDQEQLKRRLRWTLTEYFDESELRTLCFDLGIDYDSLGDDGKGDKARELVGYFWRRGALMTLLQRVEALRPRGRYADYFRQMLRAATQITQTIDIEELRRMSNTGPMGVDLRTILALNEKGDRRWLITRIFICLLIAMQITTLVLLIVK